MEHKVGWIVMFVKPNSVPVEFDWYNVEFYCRLDHEPTDDELCAIEKKLPAHYDITVMKYEVVNIINDKSVLSDLSRGDLSFGSADSG